MVSLSLVFLELLWIDWKTPRLNTHKTELPEPGIERHPRLFKQVSGVAENPNFPQTHSRDTGTAEQLDTQLLLRKKSSKCC